MLQRKLNEFVTFVPGINPTRAEKQYGTKHINYYDQSSFEKDYNHYDGTSLKINKKNYDNFALSEGDIVVSNALQHATIVSHLNTGKVPSLNFTKVEFKNDELDKRYFVYLFNVYREVQRQKERELQGNGPILRIPIKALGEIKIPFIGLEGQQQTGKAYIEMLKLQGKLNRYSELIEQFTGALLEENLEEK